MAFQAMQFSLNIVNTKHGTPAYLKVDFTRFFSPLTIKLEVDSVFQFQFGLPISNLRIRQILLNDSEVKFRKYTTNDTMIYKFHWDTSGIVPSSNQTRSELNFNLLFDHNIHFEVSFQVKYYKKESNRLTNWSKPMNLIWFETEFDSTQSRYLLVNTTY